MKAGLPETSPGARKLGRAVKGILLILGWGLLFVAACSIRTGWTLLSAARERTEVPLKLEAGHEARARFGTLAKCEMVIELALSRGEGVPDKVLDEALLGETNVLNIGWMILREGATVVSGSSTNARPTSRGSAAAVTKGIGHFTPPRSGRYELVANIRSSLPGLERAQPRLRMKPNPRFAMNASIGGSVGVFGGFVLGLVGVILLLLARRETRATGNAN